MGERKEPATEGENGAKVRNPRTEDLAKALRVCHSGERFCIKCPFRNDICADMEKYAADRLEKLERENADLTARAEKAEAERDAAVAEIKESYAFSTREDGEPIYDFALCLICAKKDKPECDCTSSVGSEFEWCGRGKENDGKD